MKSILTSRKYALFGLFLSVGIFISVGFQGQKSVRDRIQIRTENKLLPLPFSRAPLVQQKISPQKPEIYPVSAKPSTDTKLGKSGKSKAAMFFQNWRPNQKPQAIHYWKNGEFTEISGKTLYGGGGFPIPETGKILNLSDRASVAKIVSRRNEEFHRFQSNLFQANAIALDDQAYAVVSFTPGKRDDGKYISPPPNLPFAVQGPDHTFEHILPSDEESRKKLRAKTVSLGHGGEIVFKIEGDGLLANRSGPDFVIFENAFRIDENTVYQEFASVGVAETNLPNDYLWFPCHPNQGDILHCAGAVPTDEGGDQFDLSFLGLDKIKYIKIRDTGLNYNMFEAPGTEGFDLDALKLIHAFKE